MRYSAIQQEFEQAAGFAPTALQVSDAELLSQLPASANFSDVGTGKTVISTLTSLLREVDVTLVVVPPILIPQWTSGTHFIAYNDWKLARPQDMPPYAQGEAWAIETWWARTPRVKP